MFHFFCNLNLYPNKPTAGIKKKLLRKLFDVFFWQQSRKCVFFLLCAYWCWKCKLKQVFCCLWKKRAISVKPNTCKPQQWTIRTNTRTNMFNPFLHNGRWAVANFSGLRKMWWLSVFFFLFWVELILYRPFRFLPTLCFILLKKKVIWAVFIWFFANNLFEVSLTKRTKYTQSQLLQWQLFFTSNYFDIS